MKNTFVSLVFLLLAFTGLSQPVGYDVFGTLTHPFASPYSLVTHDTLKDARTLKDIYARYRSSWVANYISVAISSTCQGVVKRAVSTNDTLTLEQMNLLKRADAGCSIDVVVDYIPENSLKNNPPRKMNFSLRPVPIFEAKYPGGPQQLNLYLKENIMDKIPVTTVEQIELAKVRFNIDEEGKVVDAQVFQTSEEVGVDDLIIDALCNMPKWSPAKDSEGKKITQEFEFSMGTDLLRCDYQY